MSELWRIERLVPGGEGMAHLSGGKVGFAARALPGDRIRPLEVEERRGFVRARRWELVEPGPARVEPPCPVADRCGGCDWMHLDRAAQLAAKADLLRQALERTGGFRPSPDVRIETAGPNLGYRTRLRLHIDTSGRLGLYAHGTHDVVAIEGCPVCVPELDEAVALLQAESSCRPEAFIAFSSIELCVAAGGRVALQLSPRNRQLPAAARAWVEQLRESFVVSVRGQRNAPDLRLLQPLPGGVELAAPPGAFTQVNWAVNLRLVEAVVAGAQRRSAQTFLDLYSGAGNFALPLLAAGIRGVAVERSRAAVAAARDAARRSGHQARFFAGDVLEHCRRLTARGERFDLVVLDPPRSGAREALPYVERLALRAVAMVSCDPPTLARDLAELTRRGFELEEVVGYDMFPQTHHVEALAWLVRRAQSPPPVV